MNKDKLKAIAAEIVAAKKAETAKAKKPAPAKPAKADKGAPTKPVEAPKAAKPADKGEKPPQKPAEAAKPAAPAETWPQMLDRHAREMGAIGVQVSRPKSGKYHQLPAGVFVPGAKMSEYAALFARHVNERRALRDAPATAPACYRWALAEWEGDEIAALNSLGMAHAVGGDGRITCPALRNRAPAEAWAAALAEAKQGAASRVVSVAAICGKVKPAAPAKPEKGGEKPAPKAANAKPADKPAAKQPPKGTGKPRKL